MSGELGAVLESWSSESLDVLPTIIRQHWCRYHVIRSSVRNDHWAERCRCGRSVHVSFQQRENEKKVEVGMQKRWFDSEGNLERITGSAL